MHQIIAIDQLIDAKLVNTFLVNETKIVGKIYNRMVIQLYWRYL